MQVEGVLHVRVVCSLPVPVLTVLLLYQVGYYQGCANGHVLQLHVGHLLRLFLPDRHYRILCHLRLYTSYIRECED